MKYLKVQLLLVAVIGVASMGTANAQTTQNINVSATVPSVCVIDVATTETAMTFDLSGLAGPGSGPFNATTTLAWRCSTNTPATISINAGGSGVVDAREMDNGGVKLPYNLYTDNSYGTIWGDGTGTSQTVGITGLGMGTVGSSTVHGQIPAGAADDAPVGNYTDVVEVTLVF